MHLRKLFTALTAILIFVTTLTQSAFAYSEGALIKQGMTSADVWELQQDLRIFGQFTVSPTGYFGTITKSAVVQFQEQYGIEPDGIVGKITISKIKELKNEQDTYAETGVLHDEIELLPWFDDVEDLFAVGDEATVTDVQTGLTFNIARTYGSNHADVETLTEEDTETLKEIAGGDWNWTRRPVIVEVDGVRIAASMTAMPHAGRDDKPANATVSSRSGGYGTGTNLDTIKGNGMDGQFDIHFYGSRTHSTNRVDEDHQEAIQEAFASGL